MSEHERTGGWDDGPEAAEVAAGEPAVATRRRTQRPRRYQVVLHNDDYTSMEFVVAVLMKHFHKAPAEAMHIMLQVHHKGAGVAGVYPRDVAETKAAEATAEARAEGMPLLLTAEPLAGDPSGDEASGDGPGGTPQHGEPGDERRGSSPTAPAAPPARPGAPS
jgi:ATP-dependent Clp protease adaptor protein ClpS